MLSPNIHYFVAILRFVANYTLFENIWTKKFLVCFFSFFALAERLPKSATLVSGQNNKCCINCRSGHSSERAKERMKI